MDRVNGIHLKTFLQIPSIEFLIPKEFVDFLLVEGILINLALRWCLARDKHDLRAEN